MSLTCNCIITLSYFVYLVHQVKLTHDIMIYKKPTRSFVTQSIDPLQKKDESSCV